MHERRIPNQTRKDAIMRFIELYNAVLSIERFAGNLVYLDFILCTLLAMNHDRYKAVSHESVRLQILI